MNDHEKLSPVPSSSRYIYIYIPLSPKSLTLRSHLLDQPGACGPTWVMTRQCVTLPSHQSPGWKSFDQSKYCIDSFQISANTLVCNVYPEWIHSQCLGCRTSLVWCTGRFFWRITVLAWKAEDCKPICNNACTTLPRYHWCMFMCVSAPRTDGAFTACPMTRISSSRLKPTQKGNGSDVSKWFSTSIV